MNKYEITVIGRQDLSSQQAEALHTEVQELITENKGLIEKTEYWGLRNFAYKIRKNRKGHYLYQEAEIDPTAIAEIDRKLRLHEDVLRHLIVTTDAFTEGQTVMLGKQRDNDDDQEEDEAA